jgi:hypothetical protein
MHPDIEKTYNILFHNWGEDVTRVEITKEIATIIRNHFGPDDIIVMDLPEMVQKYYLTRQELIDFVELSDDSIDLNHIASSIDIVLKKVLNLDALTRYAIQEALSGL